MLIKKNDIPEIERSDEQGQEFGPSILKAGAKDVFFAKIGTTIEESIRELEQEKTIFGPSRGRWGTAEMLEIILGVIGPAECFLTSYSIKEQPIRKLLGLIDAGLITKMHCLFDERIRVHSPQAHQLVASNVVDVSLTKIHAKIALLINDTWGVSIITSANLTRNPRIEYYVINTHRDVAQFNSEWIYDQINQAQPFDP